MTDEEGAALNRAVMNQPQMLDETRQAAEEPVPVPVPVPSQAPKRVQPTKTNQPVD